MSVLSRIGISESQSQAVYGDGKVSPLYRDLREALRWFRREWTESLPTRLHDGFSTVEPADALGAPAWTARFTRYILEPSHDPLRVALSDMAHGSLFERAGARYLFLLVCQDFEPRAAGLAMAPPLMPEYSGWYAEKAIGRLREKVEALPAREKPTGARVIHEPPEWMTRVGLVKEPASA